VRSTFHEARNCPNRLQDATARRQLSDVPMTS
jgi:hypothetical protein